MASSRRFILLIFGVKLDEVRAAMSAQPKPAAVEKKTTPNVLRPMITKSELSSAPLIDFANYMPLPRVFTSASAHPKQTNLLCWHCSLPFNRIPRFIALDSLRTQGATQDQEVYEWTIDGNFCSWACAAAYIDEHYQDPKKWTLMQNLSTVRAQADGGPIRPVKRAPSRIQMRSYSGTGSRTNSNFGMTQQEYADLVESLSKA